MIRLFTERLVGAWAVACVIAPVVVFVVGFEATGLRAALGAAQSGVPGEPFWLQGLDSFSPEQARAAIGQLRRAGAENVAFAVYAVDAVFMTAAFLGLGAAIGFGLRRTARAQGAWRFALLAPLVFLLADMAETGLLAVALAFGLEGVEPLMLAAGWATTVKWPAAAAALVLAGAGLIVGGGASERPLVRPVEPRA